MRTLAIFCGWILSVGSVLAQAGGAAKLQFDVVSIKLNRSGEQRGMLAISPDEDSIVVSNAPMYRIVGFAFDFLRNELVVGAPEWTRSERWDIQAKVAAGDLTAFHALSFKQKKAMLQPVLVERCRMQAEVAAKEVPIYALRVAKSGSRMHEVPASEAPPVVRDASGKVVEEWDLVQKHGEFHGRDVPMEALTYALSNVGSGRPVVDQTGLRAKYNFDLIWMPDDDAAEGARTQDGGLSGASLFTSIQEQLGLRLEATRAMVDALVIGHIERPTSN